MSNVNFEEIECDIRTHHTLLASLKEKRHDEPRHGYARTEGFHPVCGGYCTVVYQSSNDGTDRYTFKKPHSICNPTSCMVLGAKCLCSGSSKPLPTTLLDCMN